EPDRAADLRRRFLRSGDRRRGRLANASGAASRASRPYFGGALPEHLLGARSTVGSVRPVAGERGPHGLALLRLEEHGGLTVLAGEDGIPRRHAVDRERDGLAR